MEIAASSARSHPNSVAGSVNVIGMTCDVPNVSDQPNTRKTVTTLKTRLQIRDGMQGQVSGVPAGVDLEDVPTQGQGEDFVIVFVQSVADLEQLAAKVVASVREDGLVWICYPKKSSRIKTDITRDHGWQVLRNLGYRPVRQVAIDSTWSALRFRQNEKIGTSA